MKKSKMKGASLEQAMPDMSEEMGEHETKRHMDTLHEAADIMADGEKLAKVHKMAGRKHKAVMGLIAPHMKKPISSLDELKAVAYKKKDEEV